MFKVKRKKDGDNFFGYGTGEGGDDNDFNVDNLNLYNDVDIDMSEFQLHVDEDEHEICKDHTKKVGGPNVDEELEFVDTGGYEFIGFYEDKIKTILKELRMSSKSSHMRFKRRFLEWDKFLRQEKDVKIFITLHKV